ncbi:MAG: twin-arginine translocase TatA/TatE family subunit [bacterium]|nr:twin-arginine translocase TatA/TatE family subunit [bacterium]MCP5071567.1 twin-arginine translocase TatA/TatE family subunit [bacterium]
MFGIGMPELIVILVVALLVFGPAKLPELARSLGRGLNEFRRASTDIRQSLMETENEAKKAVSPPPPQTPETPKPAPEAPKVEASAAKKSENGDAIPKDG